MKHHVRRIGDRTTSLLNLYMSRKTARMPIHQLVSRLAPHDLGVPLCRVGGIADGGYLVPEDFDGIGHCFSPGVADTADFECELYHRGISSFLADYSVSGPPDVLPACDFTKKFVGAVNSETTITLDDWVSRKCPDTQSGDLILQMDIEGAEYETLLATQPQTLSRFRMIVLELHKLHHLDNELFFSFVDATLSKILDQFEVAHLHANNVKPLRYLAGLAVPPVIEVTFLRKDRVVSRSPVASLPHPLDAANVPTRPDIQLPAYWWEPGQLRAA